MYCSGCGKKHTSNGSFCTYCGSRMPVTAEAVTPEFELEEPHVTLPSRPPRNIKKILIQVASIAAVVLAVVLFVVFFGNDGSDFVYRVLEEARTEDGYLYDVVIIDGYKGKSANVRIPKRIRGKPVVALGPSLSFGLRISWNDWSNGIDIKSVYIPDSIEYVASFFSLAIEYISENKSGPRITYKGYTYDNYDDIWNAFERREFN